MGELSANIEGIGPKTETTLMGAGITSLDDLRRMDVFQVNEQTHLGVARLRSWQSMAELQRIEGIDKQYAEGLVKSSIPDFYALANIDTDIIVTELNEMKQADIIPETASQAQVLAWQSAANQILTQQVDRKAKLTPEVAVVWEAMTCRGMRNYYEREGHSCQWFHRFGPFHAYDVNAEDSLENPEGYLHAFYVNRRYQIPELLSGCRKSPIMSIGLNPNLRAVKDKKRIYPYFDDIRKYAQHFRFRTNYKYSIEKDFYDDHIVPGTDKATFQYDEIIPLSKRYVSMYNEYKTILEAFADTIGITASDLSLGEDVSYYNFVACHSPRWDMDSETEEGIIEECFRTRQYFLNQLRQSGPKIIILFGKAIMKSFVNFFRDNFDPANIPDPKKTYPAILATNDYAMNLNGKRIRVVFSSHPTGNPGYYSGIGARDKIVEALEDEYDKTNLIYDSDLKHFERTEGPCEFCNNGLFYIGDCPYRK
jgi:predicted flap endonuclease-1-like 5' DNA nuclease